MGSEVMVSNLKLLKPKSSFELLWNYLEQPFHFAAHVFHYVIGGVENEFLLTILLRISFQFCFVSRFNVWRY